MDARTQNHLTDEQFTDLLLGSGPAGVQDHLLSCPQCSAEAERVSAAIGSFEQQTRLWAERRAAARPALTPMRPPAFQWLHRPQVWASAALAVALAAGFALSSHLHRSQAIPVVAQSTAPRPAPSQVTIAANDARQPAAVAAHAPAAAVSPATIKADNQLLSAINGELRADESTPASLYGISPAAPEIQSRPSRKTMNE